VKSDIKNSIFRSGHENMKVIIEMSVAFNREI